MSAQKGDFIGFTFDGIHSSELGIIMTSEGSRFSENLFPTIQDKTTQIPGADGTFFFGSYYTQKQFAIPIAYDDMSEQQIRRLRSLFGDKKIHDLIFDESPYKVYKVKTIGSPNLKYICFSEPPEATSRALTNKTELYGVSNPDTSGRIYKGEGSLSFISYVPFSNSRYKFLDEYTTSTVPIWDASYNNKDEWKDTSRMVNSTTSVSSGGSTYIIDNYDFKYTQGGTTQYLSPGNILVYNAGDIDTHFKIFLYFESGQFPGCVLGTNNSDYFGKMTVKDFTLASGDNGICINTKLNLIEGVKYTFGSNDSVTSIEQTGTIYNKYITDGDFFKIKPMEEPALMPMVITDFSTAKTEKWIGSIDYKYYYI
jgi:phage-related protein